MDGLELIIALVAPALTIFIFIIATYAQILQRLTKVEECVNPKTGESITRLETKVDFMLKWIAALNGEMRNDKDFKEFLEQLKEVAKEKGL